MCSKAHSGDLHTKPVKYFIQVIGCLTDKLSDNLMKKLLVLSSDHGLNNNILVMFSGDLKSERVRISNGGK